MAHPAVTTAPTAVPGGHSDGPSDSEGAGEQDRVRAERRQDGPRALLPELPAVAVGDPDGVIRVDHGGAVEILRHGRVGVRGRFQPAARAGQPGGPDDQNLGQAHEVGDRHPEAVADEGGYHGDRQRAGEVGQVDQRGDDEEHRVNDRHRSGFPSCGWRL